MTPYHGLRSEPGESDSERATKRRTVQSRQRRPRKIEPLARMPSRRAPSMVHDKQHATMEALLSNDFSIPEPLQSLPPSNAKRDAFYDQIACWNGHTPSLTRVTDLQVARAGVFDLFLHVYRDEDEMTYTAEVDRLDGYKSFDKYEEWRTYQLSDHFPMWGELRTNFADGEVKQLLNLLSSNE